MLKETVTYCDYNGVERTEDFYFNISEAELAEMELSTSGGMANYLEKIIASKDQSSLVKVFKEILLKSYGEKSEDGKRFIKSEELSTSFSQTEAYSTLFMKLTFDDVAAAKFVNSILPNKINGVSIQTSDKTD